ncbi:MAG: hypothetical protein KDA38_16540, partial [Planctomycetales bacterium]|nr:hypothetical protein [Planctomycetales bacterium]
MAKRIAPRYGGVEMQLARVARHEGRMDDSRRHLANAAEMGWSARYIAREEWMALAQSGSMAEAQKYLPE